MKAESEGAYWKSAFNIPFIGGILLNALEDNPKVDLVQLGVDFLHLVTFRLGVYPQGGVIISAESQVRLDILHAAYHDVIIRVQLERANAMIGSVGEEMELDPVLYLIGPDSEQQAGLAFPVLEIKAGPPFTIWHGIRCRSIPSGQRCTKIRSDYSIAPK